MAYKTFTDQIHDHLIHLQDQGLAVFELVIDPPQWTRCRAIIETIGRGEFAYITNSKKLNNGLVGLNTSFRGPKGIGSFCTYGHGPDGSQFSLTLRERIVNKNGTATHEEAARRAYGFWKNSDLTGKSDYLVQKGVGAYGLRFRSTERFGKTAVVPMIDEHGKLWNRQLLNPDESKFMVKDGRTDGLFHALQQPINGRPIGIAEGYCTAATCFELLGFPMICAFSAENLFAVTELALSLYPTSPIIIFADNDRHLEAEGKPNKGRLKAQEAKELAEDRIVLALPDFGDQSPNKEASDWNDLVRLKGRDEAKRQIASILRNHNISASSHF